MHRPVYSKPFTAYAKLSCSHGVTQAQSYSEATFELTWTQAGTTTWDIFPKEVLSVGSGAHLQARPWNELTHMRDAPSVQHKWDIQSTHFKLPSFLVALISSCTERNYDLDLLWSRSCDLDRQRN